MRTLFLLSMLLVSAAASAREWKDASSPDGCTRGDFVGLVGKQVLIEQKDGTIARKFLTHFGDDDKLLMQTLEFYKAWKDFHYQLPDKMTEAGATALFQNSLPGFTKQFEGKKVAIRYTVVDMRDHQKKKGWQEITVNPVDFLTSTPIIVRNGIYSRAARPNLNKNVYLISVGKEDAAKIRNGSYFCCVGKLKFGKSRGWGVTVDPTATYIEESSFSIETDNAIIRLDSRLKKIGITALKDGDVPVGRLLTAEGDKYIDRDPNRNKDAIEAARKIAAECESFFSK